MAAQRLEDVILMAAQRPEDLLCTVGSSSPRS